MLNCAAGPAVSNMEEKRTEMVIDPSSSSHRHQFYLLLDSALGILRPQQQFPLRLAVIPGC
jgi:hypothetical protein